MFLTVFTSKKEGGQKGRTGGGKERERVRVPVSWANREFTISRVAVQRSRVRRAFTDYATSSLLWPVNERVESSCYTRFRQGICRRERWWVRLARVSFFQYFSRPFDATFSLSGWSISRSCAQRWRWRRRKKEKEDRLCVAMNTNAFSYTNVHTPRTMQPALRRRTAGRWPLERCLVVFWKHTVDTSRNVTFENRFMLRRVA